MPNSLPRKTRINKILKIITIIILIVVSFFMGILFDKKNVKVTISRYPYIDFSRNFISQENYISNIQPLREKVKKMSEDFGYENVSIYIEYLNTGANISINPDLYLWPASLSKLPFAMVVMKKVENKEWSLDSELVLMSGDSNDESGDMGNLLSDNKVGTRFTIEELLKASLSNSDNTAHEILLRNISKNEFRSIIDEVGLERLFAPEGKVSAKEYSRLFRILYTASYLNRENSQKILEWLNESSFTKFLRNAVPEEVPLPHKYGENISYGVYADSGIVYLPERPYMISVMVQGDPTKDPKEEEAKAANFISSVSEEVYNYFLNIKS